MIALLLLVAQMEAGLLNIGPLATEVTHRVRASSMPGTPFVGISDINKYRITLGLSAAFTFLTVTKCDPQPCAPSGRDYRPHRTEPIVREVPALLLTARIGYRWRFAEAGIAAPILHTAYSLAGASPMLVMAAYGSVAIGPLFLRLTAIPPQGARWTFASEWSGYRTDKKRRDALWIIPIEAGIRLNR